MGFFLRIFSISVALLPLASAFGVRFNAASIGSQLPGRVSSGSIESGSVGGSIPDVDFSFENPSTEPGNEDDGGSPPAFSGSSTITDIAERARRKSANRNNLMKIQERLDNMTKYFIDAGVLTPAEEQEEAEEEVVEENGIRLPSTQQASNKQMLIDIQDRITALQQAIDNYQPPVSPGGGGGGGGGETPFVDSFTEGIQTRFSNRKWTGFIDSYKAEDGSGIAHSRIHEDIMYLVNDGGDDQLVVINSATGEYLNRMDIDGSLGTYKDYEDLSVGPCIGSSLSCIYVADTGKSPKNILVFTEPDNIYADEIYVEWKYEVDHDESIEAMFVAPNGDVYLISEDTPSDLIRIKSGSSHSDIWEGCANIKSPSGSEPTAADISDDGTIVLVKTEDSVVLYYVPDGDYVGVLCDDSQQQELEYTSEYDGQALCFLPGSFSYLTLDLI